jgi:FMN phosphatase YigB (HAD superfamily)
MKDIELIVCDLDGTLCDVRHRQHLAQVGQWDEFHSLLELDSPRPMVLAMIKHMLTLESEPRFVFLTGRPDNHRGQTIAWLAEKCDLLEIDDYNELLMRGKDEYGSDTVIKQELLESYIASEFSGYDPEEIKSRTLILDDRDKVVAHFRDLGYETWQVNEGTF